MELFSVSAAVITTFNIVGCLLCILTSKQVHGTPLAGQVNFFGVLTSFPSQTEKTGKTEKRAFFLSGNLPATNGG